MGDPGVGRSWHREGEAWKPRAGLGAWELEPKACSERRGQGVRGRRAGCWEPRGRAAWTGPGLGVGRP